jgi:hypothetical protein
MEGHAPVTEFAQWYVDYEPTGSREGHLSFRGMAPCANHIWRRYDQYKREMDQRVSNYDVLEKLADGEVISPKPDLPNISSGETAGLIRRIARNLVQNTPNVDVISKFDDDSPYGIFSRFILTSKIIGVDEYSNDMQQNLFASTKTSLTLGFDTVIPLLQEDAGGSWYVKYDAIHYRDVFPEPGVRDVRQATEVFVRRYLTRGEVVALIRDNTPGWDVNALKLMLENKPRSREMQSVDHQTKKRRLIPDGYEIITQYTSSGDPFLTFSENDKILLRIEKNKHPLKQHPVHFLVLEKDSQQPLGKSQVELLTGRQDFQDLMLNGAMKLWYRNINPSIIGYGTVNSIPNLSPGKYTQISNPNAKVEAFEVNTQTLMQFGTISQQNLGSMVSLIGAADQQMAAQTGNGMSATPQGVEAQQAMVDITTNNYQKAIEQFFSHYCSYALTMYFQEMAAVKKVKPTADARLRLLEAGFPTDPDHPVDSEDETPPVDETGPYLKADGSIECDFAELATEYWVRCVPGSLVELEDEKQLRVLNQLFIPLSQAMPALAATQDPQMIGQAAAAMSWIIQKQIELSGASSAQQIGKLWSGEGNMESVTAENDKIKQIEESLSGMSADVEAELETNTQAITQLQEQMMLMIENQQQLLQKLGVVPEGTTSSSATPEEVVAPEPEYSEPAPTVYPASA